MVVSSCSNDNMSNDTQYYKIEKTEVQLNKKNTIVTTTNVSTDFGRSNILIAKGVKLINGEINNKSNLDLWYVPFDLNLEPIIIQSKTDSCGNKPLLECVCPGGTVPQQATCAFVGTNNGDGTCSTTCDGVTCCKMVVTDVCGEGKNSVKISGILNGVIVAAEMVTFNNKKYTSI